MALPEMKNRDLEIKIVDEGTYNCTITDKTGKIKVIKINNKKFNLLSNYGSDFSFTEEFTSKQRIFQVDENFFNSIHEKPPETIEICGLDEVIYHIFVKVITNDSNMIQIINDNNQVRETHSTTKGHLKDTNERENIEKKTYYPSRGISQESYNYQKETPKPAVKDNNAEIQKLKVDNYKLKEELTNTKAALEKVSQSKYGQNELEKSLKAEMQKLEKEKRDAEYESNTFKKKYEEINKKYEDIENVSKAKDEQFYNLKSKLSKFEAENTQLRNELEMKKVELNEKINTIETLGNKNTELEKTISDKEIKSKEQEKNIRAQYSNLTANTKDEVIMEFLYWYINNEEEQLFSKLINHNDLINQTQTFKDLLNNSISEDEIISNDIFIEESSSYIYNLLSFAIGILKSGKSENESKIVNVVSNLGYYYFKINKKD